MPYADRRVTPLWLSHHYPEDYDRCVRVGKTHLCRRCMALYPVAVAVMLAGLLAGPGFSNEGWVAAATLLVLPLPAVGELVLEHLGVLSYKPARQVGTTLLAGAGLGLGFARYLRHPSDLLFWGVVATYGGICLAAVLTGRRDPRMPDDEPVAG